jgi:hypothetical protein
MLTYLLGSYLLVRHPAALERLREEIRSTVETGQPLTRGQINRMAYLKCVLNESKLISIQATESNPDPFLRSKQTIH